ncbi:hypothetical protein EIN_174500 [Entamoeba invadens IP1]|uniref:Uncharacterized protein n=1 Tax=Entamoeba invadens IP1 TaxID=370355 RepID=A0A0A1TYV0_ENTIV|nr:hypothetical protein EIN_174500 [Entamoeba invadens IP1]ELP84755.1 hypothetical protein EIN_174500 [Entamoeba invadens IP1]|eukprot:XP_004184101.1 hypothetical protein EIN_174500 [Entamoeba invadens IP1]
MDNREDDSFFEESKKGFEATTEEEFVINNKKVEETKPFDDYFTPEQSDLVYERSEFITDPSLIPKELIERRKGYNKRGNNKRRYDTKPRKPSVMAHETLQSRVKPLGKTDEFGAPLTARRIADRSEKESEDIRPKFIIKNKVDEIPHFASETTMESSASTDENFFVTDKSDFFSIDDDFSLFGSEKKQPSSSEDVQLY